MQQINITKEYLIEKYINKKKPAYKIAEEYGCSKTTILNYLKLYNIEIRKEYKKYIFDLNLFNPIKKSEIAWVLGWLLSDGTISYCGLKKKTERIKISLSFIDEEVLYKIRNALNSLVPIRQYNCSNTGYLSRCKIDSCLTIYQRGLMKNLKKYEMLPNKTNNLKFPKKLDFNLISHFIRGYFEGDGTITCCGKSKGKKYCHISICGKSKIFFKKLKKILKNFNIESYLYERNTYINKIKSNKLFYYLVISMPHNYKFLQFIYKDCNSFFLKRKFEKARLFFPELKQKFLRGD